MTAAEEAATAPPNANTAPLPIWRHAQWPEGLGRWWRGIMNRRRDHRALRHLGRPALRDLGLEPDDLSGL